MKVWTCFLVVIFQLLQSPFVTATSLHLEAEYKNTATQIAKAIVNNQIAYKRLEYLSDMIGPRLSGSLELEMAIKWTASIMKQDGLENVRTDPVMVPHWVRGDESVEMIAPRKQVLSAIGIGNTVGTKPEGITAEVISVKSFDELEVFKEKVKGKIVLYTFPMRKDIRPGHAYGEAVDYRYDGASRAAKYGAVAVLVRSVTAQSLSTPHTGTLGYDPAFNKIPAAAVTIENAEMIDRLIKNGQKVLVNLKLGAQMLPDVESANVIGEIQGREKPEEIVVIGAHLDSWDVGTGTSDDGVGCIMVMEVARLLKELKLVPRRTIRVVLFTNEENGLRGAKAYKEKYKNEFKKHVAAIESDAGAGKARGFSFNGTDKAFAIVQQIASLLEPIGAHTMVKTDYTEADISVLSEAGVPCFGLGSEKAHYFDIHHTHADTLDKINREDMLQNIAALTIMAYVLADLSEPLPLN